MRTLLRAARVLRSSAAPPDTERILEPEDAVVLTFPPTRQATNVTCGIASVQAVLGYHGFDVREDVLIRELGTTREGTAVDDMVAGLRARGLSPEAKTGLSLQDLRDDVDRGVPTIVGIQAWAEGGADVDYYAHSDDDGHFVVVIGYAPGIVVIEDPSVMANRSYLPEEEFVVRWHGIDVDGTHVDHLGIAVPGPAEYDPRELVRIGGKRRPRPRL